MGLLPEGSISFGMLLVIGSIRVPSPAAGMTALLHCGPALLIL